MDWDWSSIDLQNLLGSTQETSTELSEEDRDHL